MPILLIKILISSACGVMDMIGGLFWLPARRYFMPIFLAISISIITHILWLGFLILPVCITLSLGYKDFGNGNFSRGLWLFVQYLLISGGLLVTNHLHWYFFFPYIILGGILGGSLVKIFAPIGDFIEGFILGSIVFLIN